MVFVVLVVYGNKSYAKVGLRVSTGHMVHEHSRLTVSHVIDEI